MPSIDDLNDLVWELRDELAETKALLMATREKLSVIGGATEEAINKLRAQADRNDKALIAYARGAMVGPSGAFTAAFEVLDGGH